MGDKITEKLVREILKDHEKSEGGSVNAGRGNRIWYDSGDEAIPGFGVRLTANGAVSFILNYRHRGRERRMTIGKHPAWSALKARDEAKNLRRRIDTGEDPLGKREDDRAAPRMSDLFARYLKEHAEKKKKARSVADDLYLIYGGKSDVEQKKFSGLVGKHFASMHVDAVTAEDVERFHGGLSETPTRANRSVALLSKVFNLAEKWGMRPPYSNPCRHIERYKENARDRHLNGEELARLGPVLVADEDKQAVAAISVLLFTGMRVGELLSLQWSDLDQKNGIARLRDAKAGARDVQLPTAAVTALGTLPQINTSGPVFDMNYMGLYKAWQRIRKAAGLDDVRIHDLRHTTGTVAGSSGFNAFIVKQLLGHKTLAMTNRYVGKFTDPLKEASGRVADQISAAMKGSGAEVVPLAKKEG